MKIPDQNQTKNDLRSLESEPKQADFEGEVKTRRQKPAWGEFHVWGAPPHRQPQVWHREAKMPALNLLFLSKGILGRRAADTPGGGRAGPGKEESWRRGPPNSSLNSAQGSGRLLNYAWMGSWKPPDGAWHLTAVITKSTATNQWVTCAHQWTLVDPSWLQFPPIWNNTVAIVLTYLLIHALNEWLIAS